MSARHYEDWMLDLHVEDTDKRLNQLLADQMATVIEENFTGVEAEWWWERRPGGGVAVCQEFDPEKVVWEMANSMRLDTEEVRWVASRILGLENFEPVVLVFDIEGDQTVQEAAEILVRRSSTAAGLAEKIYRTLAAALRGGSANPP